MVVIVSCIDPIDIVTKESGVGNLVIDGAITDAPGPYLIKVEKVQGIFDNDLRKGERFPVTKVSIFDDEGNQEVLSEIATGIFSTSTSGMRGQVGRTYTLRVETPGGTVFESTPEYMAPSGELDSMYFEYQTLPNTSDKVFAIYIDAHLPEDEEASIRLKLTNTYKLATSPELQVALNPDTFIEEPDPQPCSGYRWNRRTNRVVSIGPCSCCVCWISTPEESPIITDGELELGGFVKKRLMGMIPVNHETLQDKVVVEVIQSSLSPGAYSFWRSVNSQRELASSLFQPLLGELPSNIRDLSGEKKAYGLFQASAIRKKTIILTKEDLPEPLAGTPTLLDFPCTDYNFSSSERPAGWVD